MTDEARTEKKKELQTGTITTDSHDERLRAVRAMQGSRSHVPFSSDDFARLKQEEIEREEQKFARLFPDTP